MIPPTDFDGYGNGGAGSEFNPFAIHLALLFTLTGTSISLLSVWLHWKNYRKPAKPTTPSHTHSVDVGNPFAKVPVYGLSTFVSLISLDTAFYVDTFRDIYEAFVIYAFFNLLLNKLGGERALIIMLHSRPPSENFFPGSLYSRDIYVGDPYTFLFVKRGILQFVYVKPLLAIVTMALKATGNYHDGDLSWSSCYLYLTFVYNLSVCLSLWCLVVFFYATKQDLAGFRPFPKFLCVKAIIFFSFWQSVVIAILVSSGAILDDGSGHVSVAIQDFLICMEMVPFAVAHAYAFSYDDYYDPTVHSARMPILSSIKDSFGLKDVMMDTLDTFRGSRFSYKSFEPSEGMPHFGSSRTSRIMAGLRYSSSSSSTKRWLEAAPVSRFLSTGRGINDEVVLEESEQLAFDDPSTDDLVEEYYIASRAMQFGDYNYPVIDFRSPLWGGPVKQQHRTNGYGGTASFGGGRKQLALHRYSAMEERQGCMDVIVEQGKGNYVVIDYSHSESNTAQKPQYRPQIQPSHSSPSPYQHGSVLAVTAPSTSISSTPFVSPIPTTSSASDTINQPQKQVQDYSYPHSYQAQLNTTHPQLLQEGCIHYEDDLWDYDHAGGDDDIREQDDMFTTSNVWK